jgi:hypothetical protein
MQNARNLNVRRAPKPNFYARRITPGFLGAPRWTSLYRIKTRVLNARLEVVPSLLDREDGVAHTLLG